MKEIDLRARLETININRSAIKKDIARDATMVGVMGVVSGLTFTDLSQRGKLTSAIIELVFGAAFAGSGIDNVRELVRLRKTKKVLERLIT
jgi:hypothetical protein